MANERQWYWVTAEHNDNQKDRGWFPYVTNLLNDETLEQAIMRIKASNPHLKFRNFKLQSD